MAFKTLLVLPPKYEIDFPPLGTPALVGFLKSHGESVAQWDINLEYVRFMMSRMDVDTSDFHGASAEYFRFFALQGLLNSIFLKKRATNLYYAELLENPFKKAAYGDWTNSSYPFAENLLDSGHLDHYLEDESENTFLQFYLATDFARRVEEHGADLLGLSIIGPSQIVASLTMAKYLKKYCPKGPKIVFGGQWPTLYFDVLASRQDFTRWVDFVIKGEGETPLLSLVHALQRKGALEDVPNLAFAAGGIWIKTARHTKEDMSKLPTPDFDGMPLRNYNSFLSNQLNLTFETSRECYWNRCTYCVDLPMPHEGYRIKPIEKVVDDIVRLKEKYQCEYLVVSDPAIAPKRLKDLSQVLLDRGLRMPYWCFARLEKNFTRELFELAAKAGLETINFGMETANQRIMDRVDKGTQLAECARIIRDAAESGIKVNLQIMIRLPSETFEEGLHTIQFLVENKQWISAATFNVYYLTPGNLIYNDPARHGVRILPGQPAFRFFHLFENLEPTMSYEQADQLMEIYDVLLEPRRNHAGVSAEPIAEILPSQLAEGLKVVTCRLAVGDDAAQADLFLKKGEPRFGYLERGQSRFIRNLLESGRGLAIPSEMLRKLTAMKLIQPQEKIPVADKTTAW